MACMKCVGEDAKTHSTGEHREDWVDLLTACQPPPHGCGAKEKTPCESDCPMGDGS